MTEETILIVDDSQAIRDLLGRKLLSPSGYQVVMASNGNAAIRIARQQHLDLVLLDVNLPDISGIKVLKALREADYGVPVIMITSHVEPEIILQSFRLGAKNYLQKPFTADEVFTAIDKVFAEARWQREREQMTIALVEANHKLQEQIKVWSALDKIGRAITATLNANDAQRRLMQGINQIMQVEAGSLFLVDESTGELVLKVSLRENIEKRKPIRLPPGQGIAGWVLQNEQSVVVPEAYSDRRFLPGIDQQHTGFLTRSVLAVPLIVNKRAVGVIEVINPVGQKKQFEPTDLEILEALALSVSVAVENARLYERMRASITIETLRKTVTTLSHHINNSFIIIFRS